MHTSTVYLDIFSMRKINIVLMKMTVDGAVNISEMVYLSAFSAIDYVQNAKDCQNLFNLQMMLHYRMLALVAI